MPFPRRGSPTAAFLLSLTLAGCTSSSDVDAAATPSPTPSPKSPTSSTSPAASSPPAPSVPTLVNNLPKDPSSSCLKGRILSRGTNAIWQPVFTAEGGDVTIVKATLKGRGVTLVKSQAVRVVDPDAAALNSTPGIPYPIDDFTAPKGTDLSTLAHLPGTPVAEGDSVMPILGITVDQSVNPRGARLNSIVLTYRSTNRNEAIGRATAEAPFKITWPNPGKGCF